MDQTELHCLSQNINVEESQADELYSLLGHRYRCYILERLWIADDPLMFEQLALEIAAREEGVSVDDVELEKANQIRIALHHTHLPKLADASVLEYDDTTGVVSLTKCVMDLAPLLTMVTGTEINTTDD